MNQPKIVKYKIKGRWHDFNGEFIDWDEIEAIETSELLTIEEVRKKYGIKYDSLPNS